VVNSENEFLKKALEYEKRGWSVVQLKAKSKIPRGEWKHLQRRRATEDEIRRWWAEYPNGNVGIICGNISGIAVIDIDDIETADARVTKEMPTGYQVQTKNGLHAYYTIPKRVKLQSNPKILGVELKAEGSLVAAPPSIHPEGGAYTFKMNGELRQLPQWFLDLSHQPSTRGKLRSASPDNDWVIQAWQGVGKGERNTTAAKLAGHYLGKRLKREEVVEIMSDWNERNTPPLDHDELMTVIQSIEQTHNRNHPPLKDRPEHSRRDKPAEDESTPQPIAVFEPTTDEEAAEDEQEQHVAVTNLFPSFPHEAFRGIFEAFRLAHTETTEAADEFLFASMLSAVGSVMGRKCWVWYAHPLYPNFYVAIVGTTARARKSTAANKIKDLLRRCDPNVLYYRGLASAEGFIQILAPIGEDEEEALDELMLSGSLPMEEAPLRYQAQKARLAEKVTRTQEIWDNYYHEWYYQLDNDVIDPITGRLPDNTMKLALQYALLENAAPEILPEQMSAAVTVARYWHETIRVLFQNYGMTETQKTEHEILRAVSNGGKAKEELYDHFSRNIDARTLNLALYNLQQIGRIAQEKKSNGPGRPKIVFRLKENIGR